MIANFQIGKQICTTAGGHLHHAHLADGKLVVLKQPHSDTLLPVQLSRFQREYELLQSLDIAGIVKPLALAGEPTRPVMVLAYFDGEPLDAVLDRQRLDIATCLRLGSQLARILAGLHTAGMMHRDIRPANLWLAPQQQHLLLLDLNVATDLRGMSPGDRDAPGDWAYRSPEQTGRMNRLPDYRTDAYSLGVTLYRMLTGRLPFAAEDPLEWAHCHVARLPPSPRDLDSAIPQTVSDIVMKLMAKLPEDRYQSMHGVQADLDRCLGEWQATGEVAPFALGAEDFSEQFHIPGKLYGREPEAAALLAAFSQVAQTGQPALVTVCGYSGIGKSALVHELQQPILREHGYFISGKFDQYLHDIPYTTLTQAFRELIRQLLAESDTRIGGWRQAIQKAVGAHGQLIVDILPQVELLIDKQPPVPALPPAEAQHRFRRVFRQFVGVFAQQAHPLVLFLDDLQWIDAASLQLIEYLFTQADTRYLLLIAAYRDNEVGAAHPLLSSLEAIRGGGVPVREIRLEPLPIDALNRLVADTLHAKPTDCEPLTRLIFDKTEGNPFFFTQFLAALNEERLLRYDITTRRWRWDLAQIQGRNFADNVVDLMLDKLRRLPAPTQHALRLAACLGNKFILERLALVSEMESAAIEQHLAAASAEGLVLLAGGSGKFLHDRIQQAAYSLVPEHERGALHLRIGRLLVRHMGANEMAEHLFDVANQFNRGAALLSDREEKAQVADINLRAGRKAKASAAYASACVYLAAGMALLEESAWEERYRLTFDLWLERALCEFLSGHLDEAMGFVAALLQRSLPKIDQSSAYNLKVLLHVVKSESSQALDSALACLRLFNMDLPAHPTREQIQAEYALVERNMQGRTIESLIDLPSMTDPDMQAVMRTLSALALPAAFTDMSLVHLLFCRMVNLSLEHGVSNDSAYGFAAFETVLGHIFHRYHDAYRFTQLACSLVDKHGFVAEKAKVYLFAGFTSIWTQPVSTAMEFMRTCFRAATEADDLAYACYSAMSQLTYLFLVGTPLDKMWRESEKNLASARQARFRDVEDIIVNQQRFIAAMQGRTTMLSSFSDSVFDENAFEAQPTSGRMPQLFCWYWTLKLEAGFLAGDHAAAFSAAGKAETLLWSAAGQISLLHYHYYSALTRTAAYGTAGPDDRLEWHARLMVHEDQLREWVHNNPPTFGDKYALVSAEIARIDGRDADAMRLYQEAIASARDNGFVQNEGIAYECASAFYRARGYDIFADAYIQKARDCFARWGASGKVAQLEALYPVLRVRPVASSALSAGADAAQLDALAVAKASQAISGRIMLDELVDTLMRIVLENAGAQSGSLLLARDSEWLLAADAHVDRQAVQVRLHLVTAASMPLPLPASILNYVRRSREQVLLGDTAQPHLFSSDDYFVQHHPKSVLCLPILRQNALIGVLYLENSLVTHAFTPQRLKVLELLAAQAAISLENALLYADLRESEARIRRLVESNIIGIFFWDLHGGVSEANDAFLQMMGYSRQDLLSGNVHWASMTPPEYRDADARALEELTRTGGCTPYEKAYIRKDGSLIPVLLGGAFLEGSQEHGVAFVLDLTQQKQSEAERQARQVAEAANEAKSAFLANMSHELRSPLNVILGYARLMGKQLELPREAREDLTIIERSGEYLRALINQVLDLSKIEAGRISLNETNFDLTGLLNELEDMLAFRADEKGLTLIFESDPEIPRYVRADPIKLRQILINLLSNALKFTQQGSVALHVSHVLSSPDICRLMFEVIDTGPGIAPRELDGLFDAFVQATAGQQTQEGTGLGLAISRSFVRLMGGEIRLDSQVGKGTTVNFGIPVRIVEADALTIPPRETRRVVALAPDQPQYRILVTDDRAEARQLLVRLLSPLGFDVREANNGQEAVEICQAWHPHLIWMDIRMPVLDGCEAARRIRAMDRNHSPVIIALTASSFEEERANVLAAGCNDFLRKPFFEADMFALIEKHLGVHFVYEEELSQASALPMHFEAATLALLPPELLKTFEEALIQLDAIAVSRTIAEIRTHNASLADALEVLADKYQFDQLLELIQDMDSNTIE